MHVRVGNLQNVANTPGSARIPLAIQCLSKYQNPDSKFESFLIQLEVPVLGT